MSICVAVSVPDGIALCADTRTAWFSYQDSIKQRHSHRYILLEQPLTIPIGWTSLGRKLFCLPPAKPLLASAPPGRR